MKIDRVIIFFLYCLVFLSIFVFNDLLIDLIKIDVIVFNNLCMQL